MRSIDTAYAAAKGGESERSIAQQANEALLDGGRAAAVATANADCAGAEADEERDEGAEDEPVGVAEGGIDTAVTRAVASNAEEDHLEDPRNERNDHRDRTDEAHENCADAVVACAADSK